jgi:hypothetical protein
MPVSSKDAEGAVNSLKGHTDLKAKHDGHHKSVAQAVSAARGGKKTGSYYEKKVGGGAPTEAELGAEIHSALNSGNLIYKKSSEKPESRFVVYAPLTDLKGVSIRLVSGGIPDVINTSQDKCSHIAIVIKVKDGNTTIITHFPTTKKYFEPGDLPGEPPAPVPTAVPAVTLPASPTPSVAPAWGKPGDPSSVAKLFPGKK